MSARSSSRINAATSPSLDMQPHRLVPAATAHAVRSALLIMACTMTVPLTAQAAEPVAASAQTTKNFNVAAGPLATALTGFAADSGVSVSAPPELLKGISSPGLKGSYAVQEGLAQLLLGSGLEASGGGKTFVLRKRADGAAATGPAVHLPAVTVTATNRSGSTEDTGSYTTRATAAAIGLSLSLRETPQSVSVVTRQQIADQGFIKADDALASVTGVHGLAWDTKRTYYWARGFSVDRISYDGVVSNSFSGGSYGGNAQDLEFYDRVEVVRGAAGLLTGAGEPSATINYVRKRADSKVFDGHASVNLGSWSNRRATIDLSTPLTAEGNVRARVVGVAQEKKSFRDYYEDSKRALYAVVEADVTPQTRLSLGMDYQRDKPTGATWGGLPLLYNDGTRTDWSRSMNEGPRWSSWDSTNQSVFADLEHRFDNGWSIKGNLTQREMKYDTKLLYLLGGLDRSDGTGLTPYGWKGDSTHLQTTGSLQASGPFSLLGREHELIAGITGGLQRSQDNSWNAINAANLGDFHQWNGSYPEPAWGGYAAGDVTRTRENAAYVASRLSVADPLKVILGGRFTSWRSTVASTTQAQKKFTPYVGAIYDLDRVHSLYASYTEIFNPQNYRNVSGNYLDPTTGSNSEIGLKGEYLDGRLNVSVAIFKTRQDNVATQDGTKLVPGTTSYAYLGADGVKSRGIEAEVSGEPLPGWNLNAGISRTLAKNSNGSVFSPDVPRTLFKVGTAWRLPGAWQHLTAGGSVRWQNATYSDITVNSGTYRYGHPSFAVVGLMLRYDVSPKLSLQLNANNIFDKKYWAYFSGQGTYGDPRNFLATMKYRF